MNDLQIRQCFFELSRDVEKLKNDNHVLMINLRWAHGFVYCVIFYFVFSWLRDWLF